MILASLVIGGTDVLAAGWALLKNFSIDDKLSELNADWFFHQSDVSGEVSKGDTVEFWLADSPNPRRGGLIAVEIMRVQRARPARGLTAPLRPPVRSEPPPE